ncbi:hypothetical protein HHI36_002555 [Cryptolaemus montrouzieri]|uniref:Uncharacterized protein n=1 Tax=Cryptolaemus montrouzieri TaxID=559131 RepID=A0ABD2PB56_9CUCU
MTSVVSTLVDYILTNFDDVRACVHDIPKITDYSVISAGINDRSFRQPDGADSFHLINLELISCNFELDCVDVNLIYDDLSENRTHVVDKIAPLKSCVVGGDSLPYYDSKLKEKQRKKIKHINFSNQWVD